MKKVVVTVPVKDADALRQAIGGAGGGDVWGGKYSHVSFSVRGVGRFLPAEGAKPAIGEVGKFEEVDEERIEVSCDDERLDAVVAAIRATHPYEEPVIDIYEFSPA